MSFWVPSHPPDHGGVRSVNRVQMPRIREPKHNLTIMRGAREEFLLEGVPCDHCDLVLMLLEHVELLHHPDIVHLDRGVARPGEQPVAIDWVPSHLVYRVIVRLKSVDLGAKSGVPDLDLVVLAPSDN